MVVSGEYDKNSVEPVNVNELLISENGYCTFRACVLANSNGDICYLINKEYVNCSYSGAIQLLFKAHNYKFNICSHRSIP